MHPILAFLLLSCIAAHAHRPSVEVSQGRLTGLLTRTSSGRPISAFLGIPFARPPTGQLRFQAPKAAEKWRGVLNATRPPPDCLQYSHVTYHFPYCPVTGEEDCLYLNVYTPWRFDGADDSHLMDVLVYIHPGTWMYYGSSFQGPEVILDGRDMVLVTFNYRLGPLGFLSTGDNVVPGNNGLKDQVLALKWIQKNIKSFGGDPKRVTIAGLSAGAISVHYHMLTPSSKGLFWRGISASGSALCPWALADRVPEKSREIAAELGCPTSSSTDMVDCLRNRPGHHIVGLVPKFMPWLYNPYAPFGPVVEPAGSPDAFLSAEPKDIIESGDFNHVPWLLSFVSDEGLYPAAEILGTKEYVKQLDADWDTLLPLVLHYNVSSAPRGLARAARAHYSVKMDTDEGKRNFVKMVGDRLYMNGISEAAKLHARTSQAPVYMYHFDFEGKNTVVDLLTKFKLKERLGICHGDDILHVFPTPWLPSTDRPIGATLVDIWTKFAANGKADWEAVHPNELVYLKIRGPTDWETLRTESLGDPHFWNNPSDRDEL